MSSFPKGSHEKYIDKLKARIDVVREGLVSNPLDVDLQTTINELMSEVTRLIYNKNWITPLPTKHWLVIINFILSLNEISQAARKANRSLNFSAQRASFVVLGYVFNHPQYEQLCDRRSNDKANDFDVIQTMYSEAERQNYDPLLFVDLYAEGEWISKIMGHMAIKFRSSPNQEGLHSALNLWENFVSLSAKSNPDRIPKLFENIKEAATSNLHGGQIMPLLHPVTEEFKSWQKMFKEIQLFRISNLKQNENAIRVLHGQDVDGEFAIFNGAFDEDSKFFANSLPEIEDIWFECIQGSVFDSLAYLYGVCAFHDLWKQLRECWYLSQPEDADAIYCDHPFFTRDSQAFIDWITNHIVPMERITHDRHNMKVHIAGACIVLMGDILNTKGQPSFRFETIENSEQLERFITLLKSKTEIIHRESVRNAFGWDFFEANCVKSKVDDFLGSELDRCRQFVTDSLKRCIPNITINSNDMNLNRGDRELVYEAWNQTNQNFWRTLNRVSAFKLSFSRNILQDAIHFQFTSHESYYLCERSGKRIYEHDFFGEVVATKLIASVTQKLKAIARCHVNKVNKDATWFICEIDWNKRGWDRLKEKYGFDFGSGNTIHIGGEQSFVAEKDSTELILHERVLLPWSEGKFPVIVYGFTDFSEFTTGVSSIYYQLKVLNPAGIYLI